jgi:peroxiredoxin
MTIAGVVRYLYRTIIGKGGTMLNPGDEAPEFDLFDHRGEPLRLKDLRGKKVVLWFFPKADTPG